MARFLPRTIRNMLVCASAIGALLTQVPAQAADVSLWKDIQKAGVLRCGAAVAAPYVMRDARSGEYSGYFVDLCRDFGERVLKVKVEFVDTNWDNLVAGLQGGKWDMAMALNQTPERALAVSFSVPATDYQVSLLINKDNPKLASAGNTIGDFDKPDVTFAVMSGTAQDKAISARHQAGQDHAPAGYGRGAHGRDVQARRRAGRCQRHQSSVRRGQPWLDRRRCCQNPRWPNRVWRLGCAGT